MKMKLTLMKIQRKMMLKSRRKKNLLRKRVPQAVANQVVQNEAKAKKEKRPRRQETEAAAAVDPERARR